MCFANERCCLIEEKNDLHKFVREINCSQITVFPVKKELLVC